MQTITAQNPTAAYKSILELAERFKKEYIYKSTPAQQCNKYFEIGCEGYLNTPEYTAILQQNGFDDEDSFYAACKKTEWWKGYNMFSAAMSDLDENTYKAVRLNLVAENLWKDEDTRLDGARIWAVMKLHAPKVAQLHELAAELGYTLKKD